METPLPRYERHFFVCTNQPSGVGEAIGQELKYQVKKQKMLATVTLGSKPRARAQLTGCLDQCKYCKNGPGAAIVVYPEGTWYGNVLLADVAEIVREHLYHGRVVERLVIE